MKLGDGQTAIVTDTVGFIHKLPHQLVDAFRATLEEVTRADAAARGRRRLRPPRRGAPGDGPAVLDELGAGDKPRLVAFNKADLLDGRRDERRGAGAIVAGAVLVSGLTGFGLDTLRARSRRCSRRSGRTST